MKKWSFVSLCFLAFCLAFSALAAEVPFYEKIFDNAAILFAIRYPVAYDEYGNIDIQKTLEMRKTE